MKVAKFVYLFIYLFKHINGLITKGGINASCGTNVIQIAVDFLVSKVW